MHHKRLLSGPFREGARRSPCLQTPLCPPRLPGPGARASSRRARRSVGIPTLVLQLGPRGGRGRETTRPSPSPAPSARPRLVHRAQRVERMGAGVLRRSRKSNDKEGGAPTPAWRPTPTPPWKVQRRCLARQCLAFVPSPPPSPPAPDVRGPQQKAELSGLGGGGAIPAQGLQSLGARSPPRAGGGGRGWSYLWRGRPRECDPAGAACILGHRRGPSRRCERSVPGRGGEADIRHLPRPALRP